MDRGDDEFVAVPSRRRKLRLNSIAHHDGVLRFGSVECKDKSQWRLHVAAAKERVFDGEPGRVLRDSDWRTPTASHIAASRAAVTRFRRRSERPLSGEVRMLLSKQCRDQ